VKEPFSEIKVNTLPYEKVYAVSETAGLMYAKVFISIQGEQIVFDMMEKPEAAKLAEIISNCVARRETQGNNAKVVSPAPVFPVSPSVTTSADDAVAKVKVEIPIATKQDEPQKVLGDNGFDIEAIINSTLQKKEVIDKAPSFYFSPDIPKKKKAGAMGSYVHLTAGEEMLCLYDSTVFGGAKEGICLTNQAIYWKTIADVEQSIRYEEIASVTVNGKNLFINDKQVETCPAFDSIKEVLDQIVGGKDLSTQPVLQSAPVVTAPVEASMNVDSKPDAVDSAEVYLERAKEQDAYGVAIEEIETPVGAKQERQLKEKFFWRPGMGIVISTGSINNDFEIIDTVFAMDSASEGIFSGADPDKAFAKVKEQLKTKCKTLGGNAVLDCQFEYRFAVGSGLLGGTKQVVEIFAYGTVVKIN
jgi:hypothetical protein